MRKFVVVTNHDDRSPNGRFETDLYYAKDLDDLAEMLGAEMDCETESWDEFKVSDHLGAYYMVHELVGEGDKMSLETVLDQTTSG